MRGREYVPFDSAEIEAARQMDLLTYLRLYEPTNLVHAGGNIYSTKEHDSLKISNGKWFWWSRGFGGVSALDYLVKVRDIHFTDAVEILSGRAKAHPPQVKSAPKDKPRRLLLPPKYKDSRRVIRYLTNRGIDESLVRMCLETGVIYESADYHSVIFIGKDKKGESRYGAVRSTKSGFRGDAAGSDKGYSFRLLAKEQTDTVHIFESAIDLLSYATYLKHEGRDYERENLLSLSGVYQPQKRIEESKIPIAVSKFLKENPNIRQIFLHLDNDRAGRLATETLKVLLEKNGYDVLDRPPPAGKDVNDFLLLYFGKNRQERKVSAEMCR